MVRNFRQCWSVALVLLSAGAVAAGAQARSTGSNNTPYPSTTNTSGRASGDPNARANTGLDYPPEGLDPSFSHRQMVARRDDLKRRMTENAARLLVLTRALETDLQGREATQEDAKRLDEIAKLAHTVREQMRQ